MCRQVLALRLERHARGGLGFVRIADEFSKASTGTKRVTDEVVCDVGRDCSVTVIDPLLPIINHRPFLHFAPVHQPLRSFSLSFKFG